VNTGQILKRLPEFTPVPGSPYVTGVAFSLSGDRIITGSLSEGTSLWSVTSGEQLRTFPEAPSPQESLEHILRWASGNYEYQLPKKLEKVVFSPDGKRIADASEDGTVQIWDVASGEMLAILRGHEDSLSSIAFSSDGVQVVTASASYHEAFLWDVTSKQVLAKLTEFIDDPDYATFLPDGKLLLAAENEVRVYALENGQMTQRFEQQTIEAMRGLRCAALSPDRKQIALLSNLFLFPPDNAVYVWERGQGAMRAILSAHAAAITGVCFSHSGEYLLTSSKDGTARIWSLSQSVSG
jgi:WD40 repeat protein